MQYLHSLISRKVGFLFLTVLLAVIVLPVFNNLSFAGQIPRGVRADPCFYYFGRYPKGNGNQNWIDNGFYYPQLKDMGITFTISKHYWDANNSSAHRDAIEANNLELYILPSSVDVPSDDSTTNFRTDRAMHTTRFADEIWPEEADGLFSWDDSLGQTDFFRFDLDPGEGGTCRAHLDDQIIEYYKSEVGTDNEGYIFKDEVLSTDLHHYSYIYWVEFEMRIHGNYEDEDIVATLEVYDPDIPIDSTKTYIIEADMFTSEDVWQWIPIKLTDCARAHGNTKISLCWWETVSMDIRSFKFYDKYHQKLYFDDHSEDYWDALQVEFETQRDGFDGPLKGWFNNEPWRGTWELASDFNDSIDSWMADDDLFAIASPMGLGTVWLEEFIAIMDPRIIYYNDYQVGKKFWSHSYTIAGDTSIQEAWDRLVCRDDIEEGIAADQGLRTAITKANESERDFWFAMQTYANTKLDGDGYRVPKLYRFPTPEEILCQGFLGLTYGAKGFVYFVYMSLYGEYRPYRNMNDWHGPASLGLTELRLSDSSYIDSQNDLDNAFESGILVPNEGYYAVQKFNGYLDSLENLVTNLRWVSAGCAADSNNQISYVYIDSVYHPDSESWDDEDSLYVEVGIFEGISAPFLGDAISIVNRRCDTSETRTIFGKIYWRRVCEQSPSQATFDVLTKNMTQLSNNRFELTLGPGEGTFLIPVYHDNSLTANLADTTWGEPDTSDGGNGDWPNVYLDTTFTVTANTTLTIYKGTTVIFGPNASLQVNGTLKAIGNEDSLITFMSIHNDHHGYIQLNNSATDSLVYCCFGQLERGLKISKDSGEKVYIENSYFIENTNEGIKATGGEIDVMKCYFIDNGTDGAYFYNCTARIDSSDFIWNTKNGLYLYTADANSYIKTSTFSHNGDWNETGPKAGVRYYNCSAKMVKCQAESNGGYGIYGANGSYPILYNVVGNAANFITENEDHETYWDNSYPILDYGHNNFNTEDDTIIYITGTALDTFFAQCNYWGNDDPDTTLPLVYGVNTVIYTPTDGAGQYGMLEREEIGNLLLDPDPGNRIAENSLQAQNDLRNALAVEDEHPREAIDEYRRIIIRHPGSAAAPVALDRLFWLTRRQFEGDERDNQLSDFNRYCDNLARTCPARGLAWKARRIALWAMAAQHLYDEAIRGFEEIVQNHDCLADSIFAVIDIGTLHLEAEEWRRRDPQNRQQSVPGRYNELCPADFPTHREHTDELLAMLTGDAYKSPPMIPEDYFLAQNYPNPFNATTKIRYGLPEDGLVRIAIYDLMGRRVRTLLNESMRAGYHTMIWDGKTSAGVSVSSGLYFYRIQAGRFTKVKKMTMMK
ncbi:MAG: T9SS type A sorting domain-containing protein [Candidatus Hatepunaea meridiana]|nr:T9SS type A sorting domain-containing protein [Candidatus Hatepunaea meridiana]